MQEWQAEFIFGKWSGVCEGKLYEPAFDWNQWLHDAHLKSVSGKFLDQLHWDITGDVLFHNRNTVRKITLKL